MLFKMPCAAAQLQAALISSLQSHFAVSYFDTEMKTRLRYSAL